MREILFRGKRSDNGEWVESGTHSKECWYKVIGNIHDTPELIGGEPE